VAIFSRLLTSTVVTAPAPAGPVPLPPPLAAPTSVSQPARERPPGRFGWGAAVLLYAGFVVGVVVATWPLIRDPAHLWPDHHDPRLFTWVMASTARRLLSAPLALFHGNALYPYGESLAFSEILLTPSLLGLPGFVWGNPVLTYNLLLLLLWPLNGLAMGWVGYRLTGSWPAACLAGSVFCLSPYFTQYHVEFQMLLAGMLPVALLAWVRWLETQERRWLGLAMGSLTVQGLTTWYYTIILGLGLVTLTLGFLCLRWRGWRVRADLAALAVAAVGVAVVLVPVAVPYLVVHRELGYERGIGETAAHSADLLTFLEPGDRSYFYRYSLAGSVAETSTFAGFTVLALALMSAVWLRRERPAPPVVARVGRGLLATLGVCLATVVLLVTFRPGRHWIGSLVVHPRPAEFLDLAVVAGFGLLLVRGFTAWRAGTARRLGEGDWVRLLALLVFVNVILALGPVIHVARQSVSAGPYLSLYHLLFPLHVVRITTRFGVMALAGLALLAALGFRALEGRLAGRPAARAVVVAAVFVALALEYAVDPIAYETVDWKGRPVDLALRADAADVAVLEFPANVDDSDGDAMFRSLVHGKRLVNGISGFVPASLGELSDLLTRPGPVYPLPEAETALRRVYPLRYLVARVTDPFLPPHWQAVWKGLPGRTPPGLRFRGHFGEEDLYEIVPVPERGVRLERWMSYDFVRGHPALRLSVRALAPDVRLAQWVELRFNDRLLRRLPLDGPAEAALTLPAPYTRAAPNVVALQYGYERPPGVRGPAYRIGETGMLSPGDLRVLSAGQPQGSASSIQLNGVELAPDRRGYNLVALDASGRVLAAEVFDTFAATAEATRLSAWVARLSPGTIVAGAVRDEASGRLTAEAVAALRTLGAASDLRENFREAHAFVGVKGAPPGTALEALGPRRIELQVGRVEWVVGEEDTRLGFEMTAFELTGR
jgi:interleukin-like EMT inducer protein